MAGVSGENARISAPHPIIRARFRRKCACKGLLRGDPGAFQTEMRPDRMFDGDPGVFWAEILPKQTLVGNQDEIFFIFEKKIT